MVRPAAACCFQHINTLTQPSQHTRCILCLYLSCVHASNIGCIQQTSQSQTELDKQSQVGSGLGADCRQGPWVLVTWSPRYVLQPSTLNLLSMQVEYWKALCLTNDQKKVSYRKLRALITVHGAGHEEPMVCPAAACPFPCIPTLITEPSRSPRLLPPVEVNSPFGELIVHHCIDLHSAENMKSGRLLANFQHVSSSSSLLLVAQSP